MVIVHLLRLNQRQLPSKRPDRPNGGWRQGTHERDSNPPNASITRCARSDSVRAKRKLPDNERPQQGVVILALTVGLWAAAVGRVCREMVESRRAALQTPSNKSRRRERHGCVLLSDVHRDRIRYHLGIADWLGREVEEEYPGSHLVSTCSWENRSCAFVSEDAVRRCC